MTAVVTDPITPEVAPETEVAAEPGYGELTAPSAAETVVAANTEETDVATPDSTVAPETSPDAAVELSPDQKQELSKQVDGIRDEVAALIKERETAVAAEVDKLLQEGRTAEEVKQMLENGEVKAATNPPIALLRKRLHTLETISAGLDQGRQMTPAQAVKYEQIKADTVALAGRAEPVAAGSGAPSATALAIVSGAATEPSAGSALLKRPPLFVENELGNGCVIGDHGQAADPVFAAIVTQDPGYVEGLPPTLAAAAAAAVVTDPLTGANKGTAEQAGGTWYSGLAETALGSMFFSSSGTDENGAPNVEAVGPESQTGLWDYVESGWDSFTSMLPSSVTDFFSSAGEMVSDTYNYVADGLDDYFSNPDNDFWAGSSSYSTGSYGTGPVNESQTASFTSDGYFQTASGVDALWGVPGINQAIASSTITAATLEKLSKLDSAHLQRIAGTTRLPTNLRAAAQLIVNRREVFEGNTLNQAEERTAQAVNEVLRGAEFAAMNQPATEIMMKLASGTALTNNVYASGLPTTGMLNITGVAFRELAREEPMSQA